MNSMLIYKMLFFVVLFDNLNCNSDSKKGLSTHLIEEEHKQEKLPFCIEFVHPKLYDVVTTMDVSNKDNPNFKKYNEYIISAFVKNNCVDTITFPVRNNEICSSGNIIYFKSNKQPENVSVSSYPNLFKKISPHDSVKLYICTIEFQNIEDLDSIGIYLNPIIGKTEFRNKFIYINKKDLVE